MAEHVSKKQKVGVATSQRVPNFVSLGSDLHETIFSFLDVPSLGKQTAEIGISGTAMLICVMFQDELVK